jgi:hypothetical protein
VHLPGRGAGRAQQSQFPLALPRRQADRRGHHQRHDHEHHAAEDRREQDQRQEAGIDPAELGRATVVAGQHRQAGRYLPDELVERDAAGQHSDQIDRSRS